MYAYYTYEVTFCVDFDRYGDLIMYDVFLLINIESLNKKDTWKVAAK